MISRERAHNGMQIALATSGISRCIVRCDLNAILTLTPRRIVGENITFLHVYVCERKTEKRLFAPRDLGINYRPCIRNTYARVREHH